MSIVPGTNGQLRMTDSSEQLTEFGEVEVAAAYTDWRCWVIIQLKDPRLLTHEWATAVQILQDQWQSFRKRPEYRDQRLFGILSTEDICRLYIEPSFEAGPPVLFEYKGRSEFVSYPMAKDDDLEALKAFGFFWD
ncbi:hypothetical protein BP00DRAFT_446486 [Aspergillus indologenus CBS 114.80]|uniref:Uncharacterized protein n=1 Tax=Aspergillus indologenus CBS 114.80 TaxID=1450541 RepID=A0A2V5I417_9EURO|nr:hypothetical protein BP00DRAFT_446486 [Aspergillus indologenus CBS 114.80]